MHTWLQMWFSSFFSNQAGIITAHQRPFCILFLWLCSAQLTEIFCKPGFLSIQKNIFVSQEAEKDSLLYDLCRLSHHIDNDLPLQFTTGVWKNFLKSLKNLTWVQFDKRNYPHFMSYQSCQFSLVYRVLLES